MFCRRPNLYVSRNDVGERTIKLEGNDSDSEGAPQTRPEELQLGPSGSIISSPLG